MQAQEVLSPHTWMIAALYSACCTLTSEIEVKDNASGNWLINPEEAKGCLSDTTSSCRIKPPVLAQPYAFQKGGDLAWRANYSSLSTAGVLKGRNLSEVLLKVYMQVKSNLLSMTLMVSSFKFSWSLTLLPT